MAKKLTNTEALAQWKDMMMISAASSRVGGRELNEGACSGRPSDSGPLSERQGLVSEPKGAAAP